MAVNIMSVFLYIILVFVSSAYSFENKTGNSLTEEIFSNDNEIVGRTFGHNALKRLSFIFLPVMFTLGVISTLLMAIAVVSVKNLAIGVVLLIVGISQAIARLFFAATTAAAPPVVAYSHLHSRSEALQPQYAPAPWPYAAAAATGPVITPWSRSDTITEQ